MNRLKICHVIHNTEFGGTETMLLKVLQRLSGQHEMNVVSLMRCGEIGDRIVDLGVPVHAMHCVKNRKPRPDRVVAVGNTLRKLKPDVVQTWAYHADLVGGVAARVATRAAVVWNIRHATLDPRLDSRNVLRSAKMCGRLSHWVPDRILLNAHAALDVHAAAGYDHTKMHVVPNGFDAERFRPLPSAGQAIRLELRIPTGAPVLGMCGRFHPHKGQDYFIKVARRIAADWPEAHFIIAGNRCDAENVELTTWVANAQLEGRVHLLGSRSDIPELLNTMDVYLLPSVTEGMPNVVGEAMACGVPVVAANVGDAKRLMGEHGIVVPAENVPAMTKAVDTMFRLSPEERAAAGELARQRITSKYEINVIAAKYESTWFETLEKRSGKKSVAVASLADASVGNRIDRPHTIPVHTAAGLAAGSIAADAQVRPKIVHVTTVPMTQWFFLRGQNQFMTEQGFDVHAVSSPGSYMDQLREREPITTHEIPISRKMIDPFGDAVSAYRLMNLFRDQRPEIVQLSTPKAALLGAVAARAARVPVRIYQVRGLSSESESGATRLLFQRLERITAQLCNGYLVNADSLLQYAMRAKILNSGHVAGNGMSNGVDLKRFDFSKVRAADLRKWDGSWNQNVGPVIGFLGRLTRDKGTEDLYHAWSVLRDEFPKARLLLVGPHESENGISRNVSEGLANDPRVIMPGMQHDVASFYRTMDVFVYPSHGTEGFPNAPMEAAAMGLPVIATRVVGCVDAVVHDVTGQIVSPRAPDELLQALRGYMSNADLRYRHGNAGRERIRTGFAPHDLWADFRDYYMHLLRREGLPLPLPRTEVEPLPKAA